jgi:general secretion pathway protein C
MSLLVWAAVAASLAFWASRLAVKPASAPAHATSVSTSAALRGDPARLFGRDALAPVAAAPGMPVPSLSDARFKLMGVVAARQPAKGGIALIAVDGKPARAYRIGAAVEGDTVLQSVDARGALLGPRGGATQVALLVPALPGPATGTLPAAVSGAPVTPAGMPPVAAPPMPAPAPAGVVMAPGAPGPVGLPGGATQMPSGVILPPQAPSDDPEPGPAGGRPAPATR